MLGKNSFSILPVMMRPKSRGFVKLRSTDPYERPIINPKYLSHPDDVATMVEAMKLAMKIGQSEIYRREFNSTLYTMLMPGCETLAPSSDEYLECTARTITWTLYHPVGTCKMIDPHEDNDPFGVVDTSLRVLGGIKGLRVVDASVMPNIVSGE